MMLIKILSFCIATSITAPLAHAGDSPFSSFHWAAHKYAHNLDIYHCDLAAPLLIEEPLISSSQAGRYWVEADSLFEYEADGDTHTYHFESGGSSGAANGIGISWGCWVFVQVVTNSPIRFEYWGEVQNLPYINVQNQGVGHLRLAIHSNDQNPYDYPCPQFDQNQPEVYPYEFDVNSVAISTFNYEPSLEMDPDTDPASLVNGPWDTISGMGATSGVLQPGTYTIAASSGQGGTGSPGGSGSNSFTLVLKAACAADLTGDGSLDFFDVSAFLTAFSQQDSAADFTGDGSFDFFDVSAFLTAFSEGCP